ncbi:MAG: MFS transporter [Spirochaetia bacterium]|nr:MFS transporter [Spirochaetia bacterium]
MASRVLTSFRALRHRNFQLFISGQLLSLVGTWMQNVAQAWLVYRLTNSAFLLGLVSFSSQFPILLGAPWGGTLADRVPRRSIIIATQTLSLVLAFLLAAVTLLGVVHVWQIIAISICLGFVNAFDVPARQAFVIDMVGREDLMNAIALNSSMFNGARIIGPAVAGVLVANIGEGWCFFGNGVSFVAVIAGLLAMRNVPANPRKNNDSMWEGLAEGLRWVKQARPVRALLLLLALMSLVGMPYAVLMPIFARTVLSGGAHELGILMGATGIGALIGALALASKLGVHGLGRWITVASAGFGVCLIFFSFSRSLWLSVLILVPAGMGMMIQMAACNTLIQSMVPNDLRGRIMSFYSMMFLGSAPIGAFLAGAAAEHIGAPLTVALGGTICLMGAAAFGLKLPSLRRESRELLTPGNRAEP